MSKATRTTEAYCVCTRVASAFPAILQKPGNASAACVLKLLTLLKVLTILPVRPPAHRAQLLLMLLTKPSHCRARSRLSKPSSISSAKPCSFM